MRILCVLLLISKLALCADNHNTNFDNFKFTVLVDRNQVEIASAKITIQTESDITLDKKIPYIRDTLYKYLHCTRLNNLMNDIYMSNLYTVILKDINQQLDSQKVTDINITLNE